MQLHELKKSNRIKLVSNDLLWMVLEAYCSHGCMLGFYTISITTCKNRHNPLQTSTTSKASKTYKTSIILTSPKQNLMHASHVNLTVQDHQQTVLLWWKNFHRKHFCHHAPHNLVLNRPFTRTNSHFYSFVPQSIFHWNKLDLSIVCASFVYASNRYLHAHSTSLV